VDWIRQAQDRDRWRTVGECGDEPPGSCATELVYLLSQLYKDPATKIPVVYQLYLTRTRCPAHCNLLYIITLTVLVDEDILG
jgi:hypothetical protein